MNLNQADAAFSASGANHTLLILIPSIVSLENGKQAVRRTISLLSKGSASVSNDNLWDIYKFADWAEFDCVVREAVNAMSSAFGACQWLKAHLLGESTRPEPPFPLSWIEWANIDDVVRDQVVHRCILSIIRSSAALPGSELFKIFSSSLKLSAELQIPSNDVFEQLFGLTDWLSKFAEMDDFVFEATGSFWCGN
jgi:hypothetical protein